MFGEALDPGHLRKPAWSKMDELRTEFIQQGLGPGGERQKGDGYGDAQQGKQLSSQIGSHGDARVDYRGLYER